MKRNQLLFTIAAVLITAASGLGVGFAAGRTVEQTKSEPQPVTRQETGISQITALKQPKYVLRGYEGKLAVFIGNKKEPEILFDVYLHHLPDVDRMKLQDGIEVEDYSELLQLIEDYTS